MTQREIKPNTQSLGLLAALAGSLLVGCASLPPDPESEMLLTSATPQGMTAEARQNAMSTHRAAEIAQAALLLGRISLIEPLVRPFSTQKALISLVLKSTFGFAQRVAIDAVRFQALENQPVPPVAERDGMDLAEWELDLAGIAGTGTTGTVRFLVDGAEFFPRLLESINAAEESIDIRTYIFDNDDYAVKIANLLKERSSEGDIRVLLDGIGAILGTRVDADELSEGFRPPIAITSHLRSGSRVKVRTSGNPYLTGDHTKTTVIDGERAFLGGMNIGSE